MLFIQKDQQISLPKKYHKRHNHCAVIYDQLTSLLKDRQYRDLRRATIDVPTQEVETLEPLKAREIGTFEWLAQTGRTAELSHILTKHIALSITKDMINFLYESLSCAMKGKMAVAYALLRKPFIDELLMLEQLLIDPQVFIEKFYHRGDPKGYDPSVNKKNAKEIITAACKVLDAKLFYHADLLHDMRYDKTTRGGLQGITNHALHIVTNDSNYKTSHKNLNFVFSVEEDQQRYWKNYYTVVPLLLCYSVEVIDLIIFPYLQGSKYKHVRLTRAVKRKIALLHWSSYVGKRKVNYSRKILRVINDSLTCECHKCTAPVQIEQADLELYFHTNLLLCPFCFAQLLTVKNKRIMYRILEKL